MCEDVRSVADVARLNSLELYRPRHVPICCSQNRFPNGMKETSRMPPVAPNPSSYPLYGVTMST